MRFGVIGTSSIAASFVTAVRTLPHVEITAVMSRSAHTGAAFAAQHGIARVVTSVEELAALPDVDAVYIASPNALHAPQSLVLLQHKKHVLCEKPLAHTFAAAQAMQAAADASGVVLLEAMRTLHVPGFAHVQSLLPQLGAIRRVTAVYCQYSSRYNRHKAGEYTNAFNPALGNSAAQDIGIYTLEPCVALFGPPKAASRTSVYLANGFEAQGVYALDYGSFTAQCIYSKIDTSHIASEIAGENGTLQIGTWQFMTPLTLRLNDGTVRDETQPALPHDMAYEISDFCAMVQRGARKTPLTAAAHTAMQLLDGIYQGEP